MGKWLRGLLERIDLPTELSEKQPRVTLHGDRSILVENHRELISFSPERVELGCKTYFLRVEGENLVLRAMNGDELLISGKIVGIEVIGP